MISRKKIYNLLVAVVLWATVVWAGMTPSQLGAQSLAEALDRPGFWNTYGATNWTGQTNVTHDGTDAAETGGLRRDYGSLLETTVTGPAAIGFWWKVSGYPGLDRLDFMLDAQVQDSITGVAGWDFKSVQVPAGEHAARWFYYKGAIGNWFENKAWVDEVRVTTVPLIIVQPQPQSLNVTMPVNFSVTAFGVGTLTYQWFHDALPLAGATNAQLFFPSAQLSHGGAYFVLVSNSLGAITSAVVNLTVYDLAAATDATNLNFTTSGVLWRVDDVEAHDGTNSAVSGPVVHLSESPTSVLEATAASGGVISFWAKVSSREATDFLSFEIGTDLALIISGEQDWQFFSFPVPPGKTMRWMYQRWAYSFEPPAGQDRGWIDGVSFAPTLSPVIETQPVGGFFPANAAVILSVVAYGAEPLSYQWSCNETNIPGATNSSLIFSNLQLTDSGDYFVVVSNAHGAVTSSVVSLTVSKLASALGTTNVIWSTTGHAEWFFQTNVTHDAIAALESGHITDVGIDGYGNPYPMSQYSLLEGLVVGPGTISFWWKVSSEEWFDVLQLSLFNPGTGNETNLATIFGEVNWQQKNFYVPEGEHILRWNYSKDASITAGQDRAWLDEVVWAPLVLPIITSQPQQAAAGFAEAASFSVEAFSGVPLTYQWHFGNSPLLDQTNTTLTVTSVTPESEGGYFVVVSTSSGSVTSQVAQLRLLTLAEALDNDTLAWSNTFTPNAQPAARWMPQTVSVHDGVDAVQLGPFPSVPTSLLETTVNGPGLLSFYWAASSPAEGITFWIGTNLIQQRIQTDGWEYREFEISPGLHTLRWGYSNYQDTVEWEPYGVVLDRVVFQQAGLPPVFTLQPQDAHARPYIDANGFTADGTGYPAPTRQWLFNGQPLPGQTDTTLSISPVELTNAGSYQMVLSNPNGSVTSTVARLILHKQHLEMAQNLGCVEAGHEEVDVQVVGDRAYVAEFYFGLRVFDVANPASPVLIGSHPTASYARGVTVSNGLAYVAASSAGVQILDVSNPLSISQVGSHSSKGEATATALAGSRLYVADGPGGLGVLDVSQPTNVIRLGTFRPPGSVLKVRVVGNVAYLASFGSGLYAVDCTDPVHPVMLDFFPQPGATDLQIVGDVVYLASLENQTLSLNTFRLDPTGALAPLDRWGQYAPGALPPRVQVARGVVFISLWAASIEFTGLITLDAFDPARLVWTSEFGTGSYPNGFQIVGDHIFIANGGTGFCVYRMNEFPAAPPRLNNVTSQNGVFRATVTDVPDHFPVVIECSADLQTWIPMQTNSFFGPAWEFSYDPGTNSANKFFRVRTY